MKFQAIAAVFLLASASLAIPLSTINKEARDEMPGALIYMNKRDVQAVQPVPENPQTNGVTPETQDIQRKMNGVSPKMGWIQDAQRQGKSAQIIQFLQGVPESVFNSLFDAQVYSSLTGSDPSAVNKAVEQLMNGQMPTDMSTINEVANKAMEQLNKTAEQANKDAEPLMNGQMPVDIPNIGVPGNQTAPGVPVTPGSVSPGSPGTAIPTGSANPVKVV
ncbi:hypothetical protein ABW20_dc0104022 [Dactylellina cionopaga]|nr:hypothetical protein ABW20_dc0104022 [Dactylellina cionopaga]